MAEPLSDEGGRKPEYPEKTLGDKFQNYFLVQMYQWLKDRYSSGCPVRCLVL